MTASPTMPDAKGYFGQFGGTYIPETLHHAVAELAAEYDKAKADPTFAEQMDTQMCIRDSSRRNDAFES